MDEPRKKPLPENIKNSIYVHHITDSNFHIYAKLLSQCPQNFRLLRPSRDGANLSFVEPKEEVKPYFTEQNVSYYKHFLEDNANKRLIALSFDKSETLTKLYFTSTISYLNLNEFATDQRLVLNLVHNIENDERMQGITTTSTQIIAKINQHNLFNNDDFYHRYINKKDKIKFPAVSKIEECKGNILVLTFVGGTIGVISKKQLFAAISYISAPQKIEPEKSDSEFESLSQINIPEKKLKPKSKPENHLMSQSISQAFLPPPNIKKREAETDLDNTSKRAKVEESDIAENTINNGDVGKPILGDSNSLNF